MTQRSINKNLFTGFTLIEIIVYIAILVIIVTTLSTFFLWGVRSNTKTKAMRETLDSARRAIEIMSYETKEGKSVYISSSVFDSHPGQLSLETTHYLPEGETASYIDFYLCGTQLCFKKESQDPIALTSDSVEVSNLVFNRVVTGETPSIEIDLEINYKNPTDRPEYRASVNLKSTASLRSY